MKKIILAPNPTGAGHNMRMLAIGKGLLRHASSDIKILVLLGSMQDVFAPLFETANIEIINLSPSAIIDYSVESHLERNLNWNTMIKGYFVPTFFNGNKILRYLDIFTREKVDIVISDYNVNASLAAIISGRRNIFVTERHNFTLVDVEVQDLIDGGFKVNINEIEEAKRTLNNTFDWIMQNTDIIITDKPYVEKMDSGKLIEKYFNSGKIHFVGPIYSSRSGDKVINLEKYGIDLGKPYIVGTVSGTTMIEEDREKNIQVYIDGYKMVRKQLKNLQLILLGNIDVQGIEGVHVVPYMPDWTSLIEKSVLLISHPGWITVTEVSKLNIPALFYLPNFMEYHEVEAYRRLECLGLPVFVGSDVKKFADKISEVINNKDIMYDGYNTLAPEGDGLMKAVSLIESCI